MSDTDPDTTPWWGRIVDRDGHRVRQVTHILRTGSQLPDDEIGVALDDPEETVVGVRALLPPIGPLIGVPSEAATPG